LSTAIDIGEPGVLEIPASKRHPAATRDSFLFSSEISRNFEADDFSHIPITKSRIRYPGIRSDPLRITAREIVLETISNTTL
jgi:hypothetical protein